MGKGQRKRPLEEATMYSAKEAAEILEVSFPTFNRLVKSNIVTVDERVGNWRYFNKQQINEFKKNRIVKQTPTWDT
jgi:predicted site-specific integrase-resolvase